MDHRRSTELLKFLAQSVLGGLAVAFVILAFFPNLIYI